MEYELLFAEVAKLSSAVLDLDANQVAPNSNFFELGGDSVKAMQLCALIEHGFPDLFGADGIDLSQIVRQPDMGRFVAALYNNKGDVVREGEL